ncbi:hypothetical protein F2Q69_00005695 [Brassica cretica]|uniref:Uncharacterized protein n=1 Tax=Brassica cretica TaxID=69181 RepID=A0A8S9P4Q8_BRACR|nr:hypothetical protein F2Q69_00005695 [Brassica cretica]
MKVFRHCPINEEWRLIYKIGTKQVRFTKIKQIRERERERETDRQRQRQRNDCGSGEECDGIDGSSGGDERVGAGAGAGENGNELEIGDHEGAFETDRHVFSFH